MSGRSQAEIARLVGSGAAYEAVVDAVRGLLSVGPGEPLLDAVRRVVAERDALRAASKDRVTLTVARDPLSRDARVLLALRILSSWAADDESGEDQPGVEPAMEWADKRGAALIAKALGIEEDA